MKPVVTIPALIAVALLGLSACTTTQDVSRNAALDTIVPVIEVSTQDWSITAVQVDVPRSLSVSEANSIRPAADIVWRGQPPGDRYAQIETLMTEALAPVLHPREGAATPVIVSLEVTRFHSLTERARYSVGGQHEIQFNLTVRHAQTGEILSGPRAVDLTFPALGGRQAIEAEAQGITQAVRVADRLRDWARIEFPTAQSIF